MKRLLVLTPAPSISASTRFRLEQYFPALRDAGIEPVMRPFLDERGFAVLYQRGQVGDKLAAAVRALAARAGDLVRATRADAVLVHREAALVGPPLIEWLLARALRRPVVFDLDDAIWVSYVSPTYGSLLPRLFKAPGKTYFTLRAAARVIAGNPYVAEFARRFNRHVDIVPTVVDTDVWRPMAEPPRERPVLGWIGTHSSLQYLRAIVPALQALARRRKFVVRVVGGELDAPGVAVENVPWTLAHEVRDFQSIDVGLYPLVEDDWSVGKSGFKAIQYMACGVPIVASAVGVTREMVRDGENGFLVDNDGDGWCRRLERLIDDAALRARIGAAGRRDAVAHWSLARWSPRVRDILTDAMGLAPSPQGAECTSSD
jgi:glycosyltransferase involved in cell wall biosynthesis